MWFNSLTFLVFFAIILVCYFTPRSWTVRKSILLAASYLFYAAWNPPFVLLLVLSTVVDWLAAKRIQHDPGRKRIWLSVSLCCNLGVLGFFKYGEFVCENLTRLTTFVGFPIYPITLSIVLPVGISFYTFQTLSYTIDVYRGRLKPSESFLDFALYVTFFPQLVAGPIVRASEFLPQCEAPRPVSEAQMSWGLALVILGLFQKAVLADGFFAPVAETVFGRMSGFTWVDAWLGTLAFAGQIYCDFAGYSLAAVGLAACLGFELPVNFRSPYAALGFSDFWRRWHVSLSTWLRDYLYIPLGGSRNGRFLTYRNLILTMVLGGFWHGAAWTFLAWGALHGFLLCAERLLASPLRGLSARGGRSADALAWLVTFLLVNLTWVFFRAKTFGQAGEMLTAMAGLEPLDAVPLTMPVHPGVTLIMLGALLGFQTVLRDKTLKDAVEKTPWWIRAVALAGMLVALIISPGEDRAFIYFQF